MTLTWPLIPLVGAAPPWVLLYPGGFSGGLCWGRGWGPYCTVSDVRNPSLVRLLSTPTQPSWHTCMPLGWDTGERAHAQPPARPPHHIHTSLPCRGAARLPLPLSARMSPSNSLFFSSDWFTCICSQKSNEGERCYFPLLACSPTLGEHSS